MSLSQNQLDEFFAEANDIFERTIYHFAELEKQASFELMDSIYRDIHSLKGSAQLFGFTAMSRVAHSMESALEHFRDGRLRVAPAAVDAFLEAVDVLKNLAEHRKSHGQDPHVEGTLNRIIAKLGEVIVQSIGGDFLSDRSVSGFQDPISVLTAPSPEPTMPVVNQEQERPASKGVKTSAIETTAETVRVAVGLLDSLMNLVGELVLIRNQVVQFTNNSNDDGEFLNLSQRLDIVTTELQNEVMKTRMQPIGNILSKFQRTVRDMARDLGKNIELRLEGAETELDKTLIEAVKDPLTHIIRNSVDHGLETPTERQKSGKDATGYVLIRAYHEGGQVVVEVSDDGRGLSREKISRKAIEKGLVSESDLGRLSEREIQNMIFAPGFSTADTVSNLSGRGVGMDVVRSNIERIGGVIDLVSTEGKGTTIRLKIPLTLAIVPALIVRSGEESFAIPQVKLLELVRSERREGVLDHIQLLQGQPVLRLRGHLLPLVAINDVLKLDTHGTTEEENRSDVTNVAVLSADSGQFGLIVDSIEDSTDIVVKPLSSCLKDLGVYSGATVLGDGSVSLVLDVAGLAARANIFEETTMEKSAQNGPSPEQVSDLDEAEYLVVDVNAPGRYAIPLCLVNRLEEFKTEMIESSGDQRVVRYRDAILPLISVSDALQLKTELAVERRNEESVAVVVVERGGRNYGLEVKSILDVISIGANIDGTIKDREIVLGTAIHNDGVVTIIDVYKLIEKFSGPELSSAKVEYSRENQSLNQRMRHRILLAEDNGFFRKYVTQVLETAGYKVTTAVNGEEAFDHLQRSRSDEFSLLLSDIEMPRLTGLGLAGRVRSETRFSNLPMIAITTKSQKHDEEKGFAAGFNKYLAKLNGELLVSELDDTLGVSAAKEVKYGT